jgi:hypothetical protein
MISEQISPDQWRLSFNEPETEFVLSTLARLGRQYSEDISHMSPALRAYWQGTLTRGGPATQESLVEAKTDLADSRNELRADRLALVENWLREYELTEERNPWRVEVTSGERDEFIAMLNDRRMHLAMEVGITEEDMETDMAQIPNERRRAAVLEIDVLGHFILVMLGPQIYRP